MNGYPGYGASFMDPATNTGPAQSSHRGENNNIRLHSYSHRTSESSSISYDSSRRSSNDSSKPRLSKDQQSFLEREFNHDPKPRREHKAQFAERIGVSGDKVNNWFQNKRAKARKDAKKQDNRELAYQIYHQHGGPSNQPAMHQPNGFHPDHMGPYHDPYQFSYPPMPAHFDHQDASMEPSLDAADLGPQDESIYTQSAFGHVPQYVETYTPDDSMSFFGLSGPHTSMEDLQQQQRRFGSTSTNMTMGTISEEMEDGHHDMAGFNAQPSMLRHDMSVNLNDSIDPANFEMPSFAPYPSMSQGPHTTWGASAGAEEYDPFSTRYTTQPPPVIMASTPTPTLPPSQPSSSLPYRPADSIPVNGIPYNGAQIQAFHQAPPPFFDQPIVPSQHKRPPPALQSVGPFNVPGYHESSINQGSMQIATPERMDSVVSNMPESASNFVLQSRGAESLAQKPSGTALSTLTTRKQRRPAPLTMSARSSSFGSTAPSSPRTSSMDANLRRIKSSGNFAGGRVQKLTNSANSQRSPLNPNFNQAELTRCISSQSMTNLAGGTWRQDSQGPITPASPGASFRSGSSSGPPLSQSRSMSQLRYVPNAYAGGTPLQEQMSGGQTPTFLSYGPLYDGPFLEMSPPDTPSHAMSGFAQSPFPVANYTHSMGPPSMPSSAPAHQQTFFPEHYNQPQPQALNSQHGFLPQQQIPHSQQMPPSQQMPHSQQVPHLHHPAANDIPNRGHMRTATAQYVGPPQPQFYQHPNESAPVVMGRSNASAEMLAQPVYGSSHIGLQTQPPNSVGGPPPPGRLGDQQMQQQFHQGQMYDQGQQQRPQEQQQHQQQHQRVSPPEPRLKVRSRTMPMQSEPTGQLPVQAVAQAETGQSSQTGQSAHQSAHTAQAGQTSQTGPTKVWPYTSRFTPHNTEAFSTWDLNERSTPTTTTVPEPPQERKYSFVQWEGGNGSVTPDKVPKSAGLSSNYSKIEFLNTSPQAFMASSSTTPVPG